MKRTLFCFVLLLGCCAAAFAEKDWKSISEICEETPDRWVQTYETKWRTIEIDVEVQVPNVDQVPILLARKAPPVQEELLVEYAGIEANNEFFVRVYSKYEHPRLNDNEGFKYRFDYPNGMRPDQMPENLDMSLDEAEMIFGTQYKKLYGCESVLDRVVLYSNQYKVKKKNSELIFGEPVRENGEYWLEMHQLIEGLRYEACESCYEDYGRSIKGVKKRIWPDKACISGHIWGRDTYEFMANGIEIVEVAYEDIPLLSFQAAKSEIEKQIEKGYLRTVDRIELVYAPYSDSQRDDVFWLIPVWYIEGGYTRNATREFKPHYESDGVTIADDGIERAEIVFEAQKGQLMDYKDTSRSRRVLPKVYTWNDVR